MSEAFNSARTHNARCAKSPHNELPNGANPPKHTHARHSEEGLQCRLERIQPVFLFAQSQTNAIRPNLSALTPARQLTLQSLFARTSPTGGTQLLLQRPPKILISKPTQWHLKIPTQSHHLE